MDPKVYLERYEYVSEMVQTFIDSEEKVYENKLDQFYDEESSWHVKFFEFNLSQLLHVQVQKEAQKLLTLDGQAQYNTALARTQSLYVNIAMAIGEEYLAELEKNCISALMYMVSSNRNDHRNHTIFKQVFGNHPVLIIASIGSAYFRAKHTKYMHTPKPQPGLPTTRKSDVALRSLPLPARRV